MILRAFLAGLACALSAAPALAEGTTVWDGVFGAPQADRGLAVYEESCAECHGPAMEGAPGSPPLADIGFLYVWDGQTADVLLDYMLEMMPAGQVGSVGAEDMTDAMAAILRANGFPAGPDAAELPADPAALSGVTILREAPGG